MWPYRVATQHKVPHWVRWDQDWDQWAATVLDNYLEDNGLQPQTDYTLSYGPGGTLAVAFTDPSKAMLFKLTWGGAQ